MGLSLARSPSASHLPGWGKGQIDAPNCGKGFSWNYAPWHDDELQGKKGEQQQEEVEEEVGTIESYPLSLLGNGNNNKPGQTALTLIISGVALVVIAIIVTVAVVSHRTWRRTQYITV